MALGTAALVGVHHAAADSTIIELTAPKAPPLRWSIPLPETGADATVESSAYALRVARVDDRLQLRVQLYGTKPVAGLPPGISALLTATPIRAELSAKVSTLSTVPAVMTMHGAYQLTWRVIKD